MRSAPDSSSFANLAFADVFGQHLVRNRPGTWSAPPPGWWNTYRLTAQRPGSWVQLDIQLQHRIHVQLPASPRRSPVLAPGSLWARRTVTIGTISSTASLKSRSPERGKRLQPLHRHVFILRLVDGEHVQIPSICNFPSSGLVVTSCSSSPPQQAADVGLAARQGNLLLHAVGILAPDGDGGHVDRCALKVSI